MLTIKLCLCYVYMHACGVLIIYQSIMLQILYIEEETEIIKLKLIKINIKL